MVFERSSGVLVHPSSFPNKFAIGDFGKSAYEFIDFLYKSKQKLWQILPLNDLNQTNSPYQCISSFAGNILFISIESLVDEGYLSVNDIKECYCESFDRIDYDKARYTKEAAFRRAFESFKISANNTQKSNFESFCNESKDWLEEYALFISLKKYFKSERKGNFCKEDYDDYIKCIKNTNDMSMINYNYFSGAWSTWPIEIKNKSSIKKWRENLSDDIQYYKFLQYEFFRQWFALKNYANEKGIKIIGDIPIYVSSDSADVWANPELFLLDEEKNPILVAGGPPDSFSENGQRWGNCLYNWENHKSTNYKWWSDRLKFCLRITDIVRIDHFRGFDEYWGIPFDEVHPKNGRWYKGPGKDFFHSIFEKLGKIPVIVEDIGVITNSVVELRESFNLPGIKIIQCAFNATAENENLPHNFKTSNCVVYTGTHDMNTIKGWYEELNASDKYMLNDYIQCNSENVSWNLIRLAFSSVAVFSIIQIQDIIDLGSKYRMNIPGTEKGNWEFRYLANALTEDHIDKLLHITLLYNR